MKKVISILLVCVFLLAISGCNMESEAEPQVKDMLAVLKDGELEKAMDMMHPDAEFNDLEKSIVSLILLVDGRSVDEYEQVGIKKNSGINEGGSYEEESGTVRVSFDDGTKYELEYVYLTTDGDSGFTTFKLSIGS